MDRRAWRKVATAAVALWAASTQASINAVYYDPTQDFSTAYKNPNGVWTYGWMSKDFSSFTPYDGTRTDASNNTVWYRKSPASSDFTPCVWLNKSGATLYGAAPGQLVLHPSSTFEPSVVRWTAPAAGFYRIHGRFFPGDSGQMLVGVRRTKFDSSSASGMSSQSLWTGTDSGFFDIFYSTDNDSALSFFMTGESVDFVVYGGYYSGSTPLQAEIVRQTPPVPLYDATAEFGVAQGNPNGVWRYGWMPTDYSSFNDYTLTRTTEINTQMWSREPASSDFTPTVWRNGYSLPLSAVAPGQLSLHPGSKSEPSVLRWTAPAPGYYKVRARFYPGDVGKMKIGVQKTIFFGTRPYPTWEYQGEDSGYFETADLWLETGTTFDFMVYGAYFSGNTPIDVVILAQPFKIASDVRLRRFDPTADFNTASNPNGPWTYGYLSRTDGAFTPYSGFTAAGGSDGKGSAAWWRSPPSGDFTPTVWLRNLDSGGAYGVAPGELSLHPSDTSEGSVVRFTVPSDGTYGLNVRFLPGDIGAMSLAIRHGDQWLWTAQDSASVHFYRALKAHDTVDFVVYGGYSNGNTPLELTITPQVQAPTVTITGCSRLSTTSRYYTGVGTCEYGTVFSSDGSPGAGPCRPDGTFTFGTSYSATTSSFSLRGVQSGRAASASVTVQLPWCPL